MDIFSLLTGALIALISPLLSGYFNIFVKNKEYQNEYFKQIVSKRLDAYEQLNRIIYTLKITVQDIDGKAYHRIFENEESFFNFYNMLYNNNMNNFWYSENLNNYLLEIFRKFGKYAAKNEKTEYSKVGKNAYIELATLRDKIEKELANDLPKLYDIKYFLKNKDIKTEFLKRSLSGEYFKE